MKKIKTFILHEIILPFIVLTTITAPFTGAMLYLLFN